MEHGSFLFWPELFVCNLIYVGFPSAAATERSVGIERTLVLCLESAIGYLLFPVISITGNSGNRINSNKINNLGQSRRILITNLLSSLNIIGHYRPIIRESWPIGRGPCIAAIERGSRIIGRIARAMLKCIAGAIRCAL